MSMVAFGHTPKHSLLVIASLILPVAAAQGCEDRFVPGKFGSIQVGVSSRAAAMNDLADPWGRSAIDFGSSRELVFETRHRLPSWAKSVTVVLHQTRDVVVRVEVRTYGEKSFDEMAELLGCPIRQYCEVQTKDFRRAPVESDPCLWSGASSNCEWRIQSKGILIVGAFKNGRRVVTGIEYWLAEPSRGGKAWVRCRSKDGK